MNGACETGRGSRTVYELYLTDARRVNPQVRQAPRTRRELVESHLFYVIQVAKEYRNLGIPFEDLMSEGNLGLLEAADRFDRTRGVKFISYATWWIRKRICDLVGRQANLIRLPKYQMERLRRVRQAERRLLASLHRPPTIEEVARECGMKVRDLETLAEHSQREISLETVVGHDTGKRLGEVLAERHAVLPDVGALQENPAAVVVRYLALLSPRQREILTLRYGLNGKTPATLAEVGIRIGVSRERVRQLERQALARLRSLMQLDGRRASA